MPRPLVILSLTLAVAAAAVSGVTGRLAVRAARAEAREAAQTSKRMQESQIVALLSVASDAAQRALATALDDRAADPARREAREGLSLALARFDDAVRAWRKIPHDGDLGAAFAALEPRLAAWRSAVEAVVQADVQRRAGTGGAGDGSAVPSRAALLASERAAAAPMERGLEVLKIRTPAPWRDAIPVRPASRRELYAVLAWVSGLCTPVLLGLSLVLARRRAPAAAADPNDLKNAA